MVASWSDRGNGSAAERFYGRPTLPRHHGPGQLALCPYYQRLAGAPGRGRAVTTGYICQPGARGHIRSPSQPPRRPPTLSIRLAQPDQVAAVVGYADIAVLPYAGMGLIESQLRLLKETHDLTSGGCRPLSFAVELPVELDSASVLRTYPDPVSIGPVRHGEPVKGGGAAEDLGATLSQLHRLGVDEVRYCVPRRGDLADTLVAIGKMSA